MLLRVGFYYRRYILISLYRSDPVIVLGLHHSVYRCIALICSSELYLIPCVLENNNRRLLEFLYSAHSILGCNRPLKILIVVSV